jgi:hypothetical protein
MLRRQLGRATLTVTVLVVFLIVLAALFVRLVLTLLTLTWLVTLLMLTGLSGLLSGLTALLALSELTTLLALLLHIVCHKTSKAKHEPPRALRILLNSLNLVASKDGKGWVNTVFYPSLDL